MASHDSQYPLRIPTRWNVPARSIYFTGREQQLAAIRQALDDAVTGDNVSQPSLHRAALTALRGMAGVGKTQLAIEFAHRNAARYNIVWWIPSDSTSLLVEALNELASALGLPEDANAERAARRALQALSWRSDWLIVYDNVPNQIEEISMWMPPASGDVIFTARSPSIGRVAQTIQVAEFDRTESVALIQRRNARISAEDADRIADAVGDLPLAVEQVGAYLDETGFDAKTYLQLLKQSSTVISILNQPSLSHPGVYQAISSTLDQLRSSDREASEVLRALCFMAPEPIPFSTDPEPFGIADAKALNGIHVGDLARVARIVRAVLALALAKNFGTALQVHRLTQSICRARMSQSEIEEAVQMGMALLVGVNPGDPHDPSQWPHYRWLTPHVISVSEHSLHHQIMLERGFTTLLARSATYLRETGRALAGLEVMRTLHDQESSTYGQDDEAVLVIANDLAECYRDVGDYDRAIALHRDTFDRRVRLYGRDYFETLGSANNLALCLRSLGRYQESRALNAETLEVWERTQGPDHPFSLISKSNLALDIHDLGEFEAARELAEEVLMARESVLGSLHPETLRTRSNLASDLRELGLIEPALELDKAVLKDRRAILGETHTETLRSKSHVATGLCFTGDIDDALLLDRTTLAERELSLGDSHPDTLKSRAHVARELFLKRYFEESRRMNLETLKIYRASLGRNHPDAMRAQLYLARDLRALGDRSESDELMGEAIESLSRSLGTGHPHLSRMRSWFEAGA